MGTYYEEGIKPDLLTLGKAVTGGVVPGSYCLGSAKLMDAIQPGMHASTYAGFPLAAACGLEATKIIVEEGLSENADAMGQILRGELNEIKSPLVTEVRGRGMFNGLELVRDAGFNGMTMADDMREQGMLCRVSHGFVIRL
jgi:ornithine--oxo-acid transaminase